MNSSFFRVTERLHLAFIVMTELGRLKEDERTSLREIASSIGIKDGYLEEVAAALKMAGLVDGRTGRNGGYRLAKSMDNIRLSDIVTAIEGPVTLVACQGGVCPVSQTCRSKSVWSLLKEDVMTSLEKRTLAEVIA